MKLIPETTLMIIETQNIVGVDVNIEASYPLHGQFHVIISAGIENIKENIKMIFINLVNAVIATIIYCHDIG
jgi:hypothetical protein